VLTIVDGKEIRLKDIWPTDEEIDAIVKSSVKPEMFRQVYEPMFAIQADNGEKVSPLYDWRPQRRISAVRRTGKVHSLRHAR
jgi:aconitate hydratase